MTYESLKYLLFAAVEEKAQENITCLMVLVQKENQNVCLYWASLWRSELVASHICQGLFCKKPWPNVLTIPAATWNLHDTTTRAHKAHLQVLPQEQQSCRASRTAHTVEVGSPCQVYCGTPPEAPVRQLWKDFTCHSTVAVLPMSWGNHCLFSPCHVTFPEVHLFLKL